MKKRIIYPFIILLLLISSSGVWAQTPERFTILEQRLEQFSKSHKRINNKLDIMASGDLRELTKAIVKETKVNLTIDPSIDAKIVYNFTDVRARDILLYLCKTYDLNLEFSGSIISMVKYLPPLEVKPQKQVGVRFNKYNNTLNLDLNQDTLKSVVGSITEQSGTNVIASKDVANLKVSVFAQGPLEEVLTLLANSNDLTVSQNTFGHFVLSPKGAVPDVVQAKKNRKTNAPLDIDLPEGIAITVNDTADVMLMDIEAFDQPLDVLIKTVSHLLDKDYFIFGRQSNNRNAVSNRPNPNGNRNRQNAGTKGNISLKLEQVSYEQFLTQVLVGSELTFKVDQGIYMIGDRDMEGLRETRVYQLQYRSVEELETFIPEDLSQAVTIKSFPELNSLIISGSAPNIQEVIYFLNNIDRLVPVVMIELIIMDVQRNRITTTGIQAGMADQPVTEGGLVFPNLDFTFGANSINQLIGLLAGQGIVNLGNVKSNFYVSLKAAEDIGLIKTRSKPHLSTLNSHEASLTIGETEYFVKQQVDINGSLNPITQSTRTFEAINADFTINLKPFVAGDEQITLDIKVNQSDFTGKTAADAPPGQFTREFDSKIRVKNGEMIALGGLESRTKEDTGSGVPILSRIPIIKWFFSSKTNKKSKSELVIFIKPTIIY